MAKRKQRTKATGKENMPQNDIKLCSSCGRKFEYQNRWEKTWESVRYCSSKCRQDKFEKRDTELEMGILKLLNEVTKKQSINPALVETLVDISSYQNSKERIRRAARRLVAQRKIDILQKGRIVDASTAKGAFEVRLK